MAEEHRPVTTLCQDTSAIHGRDDVADYSLVQAGFGAPERQNRWKVAFRLILAIPLMLWVFVLSIVAAILVFIGWICALFMGRLPEGIARFLSGFLIYVTRAYSYIWLMNDAYPPFSAKDDFIVNVDIPVSTVRRWAVLFRYFLLIPALIVLAPLSIGLEICAGFIWLIVLVKGEMPLPLFGALAAILRFEARVGAYAMMLTGKYPGELFGEKPMDEPMASPPGGHVPDLASPQTTDQSVVTEPAADLTDSPAPTPFGYGQGMTYAGAAGAPAGQPVVFSSDGTPSAQSAPPRTARIVLSRGSKRILVTFLVVGALGYAATAVIDINAASNAPALLRLTNANNLLNSEIPVAKAQYTSCGAGLPTCNQKYFSSLATIFGAFELTLNATTFPSSVQADAIRFEAETSSLVGLLDQMMAEPTTTAAQLTELTALGNGFDTDFNQVISDLSSPI